MAQNVVDFSDNPTGAELMDDYLDKEQQNVLTSNSGLQRPSYAEEGTVWLDKTSSPWLYKLFDGTDDIIIGKFDADNNRFIPSDPMSTAGDLIVEGEDGNPTRLAPGTAGTVLTSNGAGALPTYQVNPIGVLTYSSSYTYKKKDIVVNTNEDDETALYKSLVDSNIGNALTDETKWEKLSLGGGGNDNIGDIQYTTRTEVPEGGAWCDGSEYTQAMFPDIYQMLVDGKLNSTDFTTFDSSVSTNGSCGMFALDTATTSFKVPLLKDVYIKAGDTPLAFGAESLPNITGEVSNDVATGNEADYTGAIKLVSSYNNPLWAGATNVNRDRTWNFDASRCSEAYQDGAKVNPDHVVYRAYVVLYSSAAEASEAQAAEFMTALGGKANVALDNVAPAQSFKDMSVGWGMPDYSAGVDVTSEFIADNWWTSTKKGYYIIATGDQSYFEIRTNSSGALIIAGSGPTPYIISNSFFIADVGEKFYVTKKSGNYTRAVYYPFKGAN